MLHHLIPDPRVRTSALRSLGAFANVFAIECFLDELAEFSGEDINHDGRVDILDAFALARELQKKGSVGVHTDFHGDGVVDDRDVELIAIHAVSLGKRGKS